MDKKTYILRIIFLFVILFVVDHIIALGLRFFYFQQTQGKLYNLTYTLEGQTADILVMGSSRAMHQYNPDIISNYLGLSCFNAGYDNQGILYHKAIFDVITERYDPKIIILDVLPSELNISQSSYDVLAVLNPYIKKYPVLLHTITMMSPFERIKHISSIYPFNSMLGRIIMGNLHYKTKDVSANGFTALKGITKQPFEEKYFGKELFDENKINAFQQFISELKNKGISVYIVLSPAFYSASNNSPSTNYIVKECEKQNIPFISYQNSDAFIDINLFYDYFHLNSSGANKFSSDIAQLIGNGWINK